MGESSGLLHSNLLLKARVVWGAVRWIRAFWALSCWILKTSSDEGCVTSLGSLSHCLTFSGEMFSFASMLKPLCSNWHLFSHSPLWHACLCLMSSLLATLEPLKASVLGAEQSQLLVAFCRGVPHCLDSSALSKLHFIQGSLHWGCRKLQIISELMLRRGNNPFPWSLFGLMFLLPARLPAPLLPGWRVGSLPARTPAPPQRAVPQPCKPLPCWEFWILLQKENISRE